MTNTPPSPQPVTLIGAEDNALTIALAGSDSDGTILAYTLASLPTNGILYTNAALTNQAGLGTAYTSNIFYFKPTANFNGNTSFTFKVTDNSGAISAGSATATIAITPVNDAPTDLTLSASSVNENVAPGAIVGSFATSDVDNSSGFVYSLVGGVGSTDNGAFIIVNGNQLALNTVPDFESQASYSVRVRTTDSGGLSFEKNLAVAVNNLNDAPLANDDLAPSAGESGANSPGTDIVVSASGVLANDHNGHDANDPIQVTEVSFYNGQTTETVLAGNALQGLYGRLTVNADGSYNYLVDNNHAAVDALRTSSDTLSETFRYRMQDQHGTGLADSANLTIIIEGTNDAPVANADQGNAREAGVVLGTDASGNVLTNDTDVDNGDQKSVTQVNCQTGNATPGQALQGAYGSLTLNVNGDYSYLVDNANPTVDALNVGDTLTDTFNYTVSDAAGASQTALLTITIVGSNDAPVAENDTINTDQRQVLDIPVLANDYDADSNLLTVSLASANSNQNAAISVNGDQQTVHYDPNHIFDPLPLGSSGSDSFAYTVRDNNPSQPGSASGTVNLTIAGLNDAPTAQSDNASTSENAAVTIDVLANDRDIDSGDSKVLIGVNVLTPASRGGSAAIDNGQIIWNPNLDFDYLQEGESAQVTLRYAMADGQNAASASEVTITVNGQNDTPQGPLSGSLVNGAEDTPYLLTAATLLDGFRDAENDTLSVQELQTNHGTLTANGSDWLLNPDSDYNGEVTLSYTISDGRAVTAAIARNFTLDAVNDAPVALNDTLTTDEDQAQAITVIANDGDVDRDPLSVFAVSQGSKGAVTFENGSVTYAPNHNANGADSFTYTVSDGHGGTATASVAVTINAINDAPTAELVVLGSSDEDTPLTITAATLLNGAADIDLDNLSITALTLADLNQGQIIGDAASGWTFTPTTNFNGPVEFAYTVSDGGLESSNTASLVVNPLNDAPEVSPIALGAIDEDTNQLLIGQADLLLGASDVDPDPLTAQDLRLTAGSGLLTDNLNGTWSFTPESNWHGAVEFAFAVADGTVTIANTAGLTVNSVNDAPTGPATATLIAGREDIVYQLEASTLLTGFTDIDLDPLTVMGLTASHGNLLATGNGSWEFTPDADYHGEVILNYQVSDNAGGTVDNVTRTFDLAAVNDTPTGSPAGLLANGSEDQIYTLAQNDLLNGFGDVDGDPLRVTALTSNNGTLSDYNASTGTWTFTPDQDYNGVINLNYGITDDQGGDLSGITRSFILDAVNDLPVVGDDSREVNEDASLTLTFAELLANDIDVDGTTTTISGIDTTGTLGTVVIDNLNQTITYTADADEFDLLATAQISALSINNHEEEHAEAREDSDRQFTAKGHDSDKNEKGADKNDSDHHTADRHDLADQDGESEIAAAKITAIIDSFTYTVKGSSGEIAVGTVSMTVNGIDDGNSNLAGTVRADLLTGTTGEDLIKGDNGNDTINGGEGADYIYGENGDDQLLGGNSIDQLFGGNGNDKLNGGNGNDRLAGEKGDDLLTGGLGRDLFIFGKSGGKDTITDFTNNVDQILIAADTGIHDFNHLHFSSNRSGVLINLGDGGQVTLTGVVAGNLDASDFIFA